MTFVLILIIMNNKIVKILINKGNSVSQGSILSAHNINQSTEIRSVTPLVLICQHRLSEMIKTDFRLAVEKIPV